MLTSEFEFLYVEFIFEDIVVTKKGTRLIVEIKKIRGLKTRANVL
jgi:hypothetical protein